MGRFNGSDHDQHEIDNRANQLNPDHDAYWSSRSDSFDDEEEEDDYA